MRRTKIICTVGPATSSPDRLEALVKAGMNVARLNFSHGTHEAHARAIEHLREISDRLNRPIAIAQDLCGPKLRLGNLPDEGLRIEAGETATFVLSDAGNSIEELPLPIPTLFAMVRKGDRLLINDGRVKMIVTDREADIIRAEAVIGGKLSSHKGVNIPDTRLPITPVTEKDLSDLRFGIQQGVDLVAVSFVRTAADLEPVQRMIEAAGHHILVIPKIEKREAVENFDEILKVADGVLIARGDMGVELPLNQVPLIQKDIIQRCNRAGKPVITATQMLESMISAPDPTRAEATDVANSILDGTDAVMLSGETAVGEYPVEAVQTMDSIATYTEAALQEGVLRLDRTDEGSLSVTEAVAESICRVAYDIGAKAILCNTSSGSTARLVSKYRPKTPIVAFTPESPTYRQLALSWGVEPCLIPVVNSAEEMFLTVVDKTVEMGLAKEGEKVVITSGVPVGASGTTSLIKVHTIGQPLVG
jgi:pyruvate kinase